MSFPDLSVIIPYYNRADTIGATLASLAPAASRHRLEIILVDDGSAIPAAEAIPAESRAILTRILRQENRGLLFARLAGFSAATGEFVMFLDSDDLVSPEKISAQLAAMRAGPADVSYTDEASVRPPSPELQDRREKADTSDATDFYLRVQPAPHGPVFRRSYLAPIVAQPLFPPDARYNPIAEVWFYYNAAVRPARVVKVPGFHTWIGVHAGERISGHWERMGLAAVAIMTAFFNACPCTPDTVAARNAVAAAAFRTWRGLPRDFPAAVQERLLALWRRAPDPRQAAGGERRFRLASRLVGPVVAGSWLRRLRNRSYAELRSLPPGELPRLIAALPPLSSAASPSPDRREPLA